MELTAIEPRRKGLSQLFLDGEAAVKIDTETLIKSGWKVGKEVSDEELHELISASDSRRAREKALYLLEYRSHSKKELVDKISRTTGKEAAEMAADKMEQLGLINDEQYARDYANELFNRKGFACSRIRYELRKKGIDCNLIEDILEEFNEEDVVSKIKEILLSKYKRNLSDEKGLRRATNGLLRLGYSYEEIRRAFRELEEE